MLQSFCKLVPVFTVREERSFVSSDASGFCASNPAARLVKSWQTSCTEGKILKRKLCQTDCILLGKLVYIVDVRQYAYGYAICLFYFITHESLFVARCKQDLRQLGLNHRINSTKRTLSLTLRESGKCKHVVTPLSGFITAKPGQHCVSCAVTATTHERIANVVYVFRFPGGT